MGEVYDKDRTKRKFLDAVEAILLRDGFRGLGVNSIAKEAGVSKVLMYRYFGDLDGLYRDFVGQIDPLGDLADDLGRDLAKERPDVRNIAGIAFRKIADRIDRNKLLAEFMRWELSEANPITAAFDLRREESAKQLLESLGQVYPELRRIDLPALATIFNAAVSYLVLRAKTTRYYNGIDIQSEEGRDRIFAGIEAAMNALVFQE